MEILGVSIENFRGIKAADIRFHGHALLVGSNNAGKTTILEALDLALGPDRNQGPNTIDEHDFFRGNYYEYRPAQNDLDQEGGERKDRDAIYPEIKIIVVLGNLNEDEFARFRKHLEPWDHERFCPLHPDEASDRTLSPTDYVLRVGFRGWYNPEEDDFETLSYFLAPEYPSGDVDTLGRRSKQAIGFLYLRSVRTGRRAATLERGSLLETLLRERTEGTQIWETVLRGLRTASDLFDGNEDVRAALDEIERSMSELIPLARGGPASGVRVGRLTRQHLRETLTYYLASRESQHLLPFDRLGSGTANVMVFALLTAIARAKKNVIFAMEEPEIALAPHIQRAIIGKLRNISAQAIVTSHSPYVAELFVPDNVIVIRRDGEGTVTAATASAGDDIKEKMLRTEFRTRFAEGLLARSVILVEGITELWALPAAIEVLSSVRGSAFLRFDVDGAVFIPADGHGEIPKLARYFRRLGTCVLAFCDRLEPDELDAIKGETDYVFEHPYSSFEELMAAELPLGTLRRLIRKCEEWTHYPRHLAPLDDADPEKEWRDRCGDILSLRKGEAWAARFIAGCEPTDLPMSLVRGIACLRGALGHPPLPASDPLAALFRAAAPESVEELPSEIQAIEVAAGGNADNAPRSNSGSEGIAE